MLFVPAIYKLMTQANMISLFGRWLLEQISESLDMFKNYCGTSLVICISISGVLVKSVNVKSTNYNKHNELVHCIQDWYWSLCNCDYTRQFGCCSTQSMVQLSLKQDAVLPAVTQRISPAWLCWINFDVTDRRPACSSLSQRLENNMQLL